LKNNFLLPGLGASLSSCQSGELRNLIQKWWMKKTGYKLNKWEHSALLDDLNFLAHLLCPVSLNVKGNNVKDRISHVPEGMCAYCGFYTLDDNEDRCCTNCCTIEKEMLKVLEDGLSDISAKTLKEYLVPDDESEEGDGQGQGDGQEDGKEDGKADGQEQEEERREKVSKTAQPKKALPTKKSPSPRQAKSKTVVAVQKRKRSAASKEGPQPKKTPAPRQAKSKVVPVQGRKRTSRNKK
jgi:hypothetical protein